jgi:pimeloyl-ACP methyl ester carboxylesterase
VRELDELVTSVPSVKAPVLLLTDPKDTLVPVGTARRLAEALPDVASSLSKVSATTCPDGLTLPSPTR